MIIPDGDRALKRLWYAKKKLAIVKMHDLPALGTLYEGFKVKVWQQGDLDGGFIISPMGLVVSCCTEDGFVTSVADFWLGGVNHRIGMSCMITNPSGQEVSIGRLVRADISELYDTQRFKVVPTDYPEITSYNTVTYATQHRDLWPFPSCLPHLGETFWIGMTGMHWYDPDGNGLWNEYKYIADILLNFYCADGSQNKRTACFVEVGALANQYPARIFSGLPKERVYELDVDIYGNPVLDEDGNQVMVWNEYARIGHMHTVAYDQDDFGYSNIGGWFTANDLKISYSEWTVATIVQGVPNATLRDIMAREGLPIGHYQFSLGYDQPVQMLSAMDAYKHIGLAIPEFTSFYSSNPSLHPYRLTVFKWSEGGSIYTFDSSEFISLLDSLADGVIDQGGGNYDYERAYYMLLQLFPHPNNNYRAPYDSVMFHSHGGNVYTWTRHYGAVQFSNTGLAAVTLYLPTVVTANNGVRPDIAYAGNEMYTLVALKPGKLTTHVEGSAADLADWVGVKGVFIGTPFTVNSWEELPAPPTGFRLKNVRPVRVDVGETGAPIRGIFLGVAEQYQLIGEETELPTYRFRACYIDYIYDETAMTWSGGWELLSPVPLDNVEWRTQFDVSLFGAGELATDLRSHIDPANIYPTMPLQPYDIFTTSGNLP